MVPAALAGVAQWIEHGLQTKGLLVWLVAGQVPSWGHVRETPHIDVSLPLFLLSFSNK